MIYSYPTCFSGNDNLPAFKVHKKHGLYCFKYMSVLVKAAEYDIWLNKV